MLWKDLNLQDKKKSYMKEGWMEHGEFSTIHHFVEYMHYVRRLVSTQLKNMNKDVKIFSLQGMIFDLSGRDHKKLNKK